MRPQIKLAPRSIPVGDAGAATTAPAPTSSGATSSIFGDARPVNTAAREREIEERLQRRGRTYDEPFRQRRGGSLTVIEEGVGPVSHGGCWREEGR